MSADRSEPKPHLSWCSIWLVLEWWPALILVVMSVGLGRWWSLPRLGWSNERDVVSKELWIGLLGAGLALGLIFCGNRLLTRLNSMQASVQNTKLAKRLIGTALLISIGLALLTLVQIATWYRVGWVPALSPRSHSGLDYRYFKSLDVRLQQVANAIREGKLLVPQEIMPLRYPADSNAQGRSAISGKQLVNEVREYVVEWSELEYVRADNLAGRSSSLVMLAMMVEPDPRRLEDYLLWKAQEESRLEGALREASMQAEVAKREHESLALQWQEEKIPEKKSELANRVVAAEDRVNLHVREQLRLQGRLDVLANERLDQLGLNRLYPWLQLPTVSRGGWVRLACTWLLAIYLSVRLLAVAVLLMGSYRQPLFAADGIDAVAGGIAGQWNDLGWFLIMAGIWWLALGW